MDSNLKTAIDFLEKYGMDPDQFDIDSGCTLFTEEMERGLKGEKSSLMMLPTFIDADLTVPTGKKVIAVDAGGTNFRCAAVEFDSEGNAKIENLQKFPMPGTGSGGEVSRERFFSLMAEYIGDNAEASDRIGFCFSYPTEISPDGDGKLIDWTKEVRAPEVIGSMIGRELLDALGKAGYSPDRKIVILNDTVATLLAAKAQEKKFASYIGFILGTGTNSSYIEKNSNISGIPGNDPGHSQAINIESGKFQLFKGGILDREFVLTTDNPEEGRLEKMISGAYQGPLALYVLKKAASEGLFSESLGDYLLNLSRLDPKIIDSFLTYPSDPGSPLNSRCADRKDRTLLFAIMDRIIERAAKLTAAHLSAVVLKTGKGTDPSFPVCIAADGTTYYKTRGLRFRTEYYLKEYLEKRHFRFTEFTHIDDAPLIGAAVAGLIHRASRQV